MKLFINLKLRKLLLLSFALFSGFACETLGAATVVYKGVDGSHLATADAFYNPDTGTSVTWAAGDIVRFTDDAAVAGGTLGTDKVLEYDQTISTFGGIIVDEGAIGYSISSTTSANHRFVNGISANNIFDINEDFSFSINSTAADQYGRNFAIGNGAMNIDIAATKTFSLNADLAGEATSSVNLSGGGTFDYNYNDTTHGDGNHAYALNISGGSTFDMASTIESEFATMVTSGAISLSDGHVAVGNYAVTMNNNINVKTGGGSLRGATALTLGGQISFTRTEAGTDYTLDFGSSNVTISDATITLSNMTAGTYLLFSTTGTLTLADGLTIDGLLGTQSYTLDTSTAGELTLVLTDTSNALSWAGGNGTWSTDAATGTDWSTGSGTADFAAGDTVTIGGVGITGGTITIDGDVSPNSIVITGDQAWVFDGTGSITGDGTLTLEGSSTLTISNSNSFAGATTVGTGATLILAAEDALASAVSVASGATLSINAANALGATATIASGGTLALGSADALTGLTYTLTTGSTIALTLADGAYEGTLGASIVAGSTILVGADMGAITVNAGADRYTRALQGYTVSVGANSTLTDNVRLHMTGSTTTITGGGTYVVDSLVLSLGGSTATTLVIDADTTLKTTGTTNSANSGEGSFMLSNWPVGNTVTVNGTLDIASGFSNRDGSGTITVNTDASIILRTGLVTVDNGNNAGAVTLNIENGATMELYNQSTTDNHANTTTVNVKDGATIVAAGDGVTNVYTGITYADAATVTFDIATDKTLNLHATTTLNAASIDGDGSLELSGANSAVTSVSSTAAGNLIINSTGVTVGTGGNLNIVQLRDNAALTISEELSATSLSLGEAASATLSSDTGAFTFTFTGAEGRLAKLDAASDMTVTATAAGAGVNYSQATQVALVNAAITVSGGLTYYTLSDTTLSASSVTADSLNVWGVVEATDSTIATDTIALGIGGMGGTIILDNTAYDLSQISGEGSVVLKNYTWNAPSSLTATQVAVGGSDLWLYQLDSGIDTALTGKISTSLNLNLSMTAAEYTTFEGYLTSGVGFELLGIDELTELSLGEDIALNIDVDGTVETLYFTSSMLSANDNLILALASNAWVGVGTEWDDTASWSSGIPSEERIAILSGAGDATINLSSADDKALSMLVNSTTQDYTIVGEAGEKLTLGELSISAGTLHVQADIDVVDDLIAAGTTGKLLLTGTAGLSVEAGGDLSVVSGSMTAENSVDIAVDGRLSLAGFDGSLGSVNNAGTLSVGTGTTIATVVNLAGSLEVTGDATVTSILQSSLTIVDGVTLSSIGTATFSGSISNAGTFNVGTLILNGVSSTEGSVGDVNATALTLGVAGNSFGDLRTDSLMLNATINTTEAQLSVDSIGALTASQTVTLSDLVGFDDSTAAGSYLIVGHNASATGALSWDSLSLHADDIAVFNSKKLDGFDVVKGVNAAGDLTLDITVSDNRIWKTSSLEAGTPGLEDADPSMYFDIIDATTGKITSYDALDQIDFVHVDEDRTVDVTGLVLDPSDTEGLIIRDLQGDTGKTLSIVGDSVADSLVTLSNTESSYAQNAVTVSNATLQVQSTSGDDLNISSLTLADSALDVIDGGNLVLDTGTLTDSAASIDARSQAAADSLEMSGSTLSTEGTLRAQELTAKEGSSLSFEPMGTAQIGSLELAGSSLSAATDSEVTIGALNGDASSELEGMITVNGAGGVYSGIYTNATVFATTGANQSLIAGAGLTAAGDDGSLTIMAAAGTTIDGISSTGAHITIDLTGASSSTDALTLGSASQVSQGGSLTLQVNGDFIAAGESITALAGESLTIGSDSTLFISSDALSAAPSIQGGDIVLFELSAGSVIDGSVVLDSNLSKYYENIRYDEATNSIIADSNSSYYTSAALTQNGLAGFEIVSEALVAFNPQANPTTSPDLAKVMNALDGLLSTDAAAADSLAAGIAGASTAALGMAVSDDMSRQLRNIRNRTIVMGGNPKIMQEENDVRGWLQAEGSFVNLSNDSTASGYNLNSWGGTVGVDVNIEPELTLGFAITAMMGDYTAGSSDKIDGNLDSQYVSGFVRHNSGAWTHSFVASIGLSKMDATRTVSFSGDYYDTDSSTNATSIGALYELGYTYKLGEDQSSILQPLFSIAFQNSSVDAYTESGSDAALSIDEQSLSYATIGLGARYETIIGETLYNRSSTLSLRAMIKGDIGDYSSEADVSLKGLSTRSHIESAERGPIGMEFGAGLIIPVSSGTGSIFIDTNFDVREDQNSFSATAGYRFTF